MDRLEARRRAAGACGWSIEGDGEVFTSIHLAERDGQHLIFVASRLQAYYLVVHATGLVRDVGGADDGITSPWVMSYFEVGHNPAQLRAEISEARTETERHYTETALLADER